MSDQGVMHGSGQMFNGIAPRYDLLNRLMSLGMDRRWRDRLVDAIEPSGGGQVLDVATGTADVAIAIGCRYVHADVVGLDPSIGMLEIGRRKVAAAGLGDRVSLVEGDARALPFPDDTFDASCISFGIRNVPDRSRGLAEMMRVTRPGGVVAVLELTEPRAGLAGAIARAHVHHVVPWLGARLSGAKEYRYLQSSIEAFPAPSDFMRMMVEVGLTAVTAEPASFGAVHLFSAKVPGG